MATYTSIQSGNWNDTATWGGGGYPQAADNAVIATGHTVTVNVNSVCTDLTCNAGSHIDIFPGLSLTPSGTTNMNGTSGSHCTIKSNGVVTTTDGLYTVHKLIVPGDYTITPSQPGNIEVLVVAGGGGGGNEGFGGGGGGGAGGLVYDASYGVTEHDLSATVGAGGAAQSTGGNSAFDTLTANGGGAGGAYGSAGGNGGCGGGAGRDSNYAPGGAGSQGYDGGVAIAGSWGSAGGGGGMGADGYDGGNDYGAKTGTLSDGGIGLPYDIVEEGTDVYYAGGGGGSWQGGFVNPAGGLGGGGQGGTAYGAGPAAGTPNTGGGGGGARVGSGSAGGSGVIIIRYLTSAQSITIVYTGKSYFYPTTLGTITYVDATDINSTGGINVVPTMTGNTSPNGTASASTTYAAGYAAWKAFDKVYSSDNKWGSDGPSTGWLQFAFDNGLSAKTIISYKVYADTSGGWGIPSAWTLLGSNTGAFGGEETTLDTRTSQSSYPVAYSIASPASFTYYRLNITAGHSWVSVVELWLSSAGPTITTTGGSITRTVNWAWVNPITKFPLPCFFKA